VLEGLSFWRILDRNLCQVEFLVLELEVVGVESRSADRFLHLGGVNIDD
jgi:hypothetical protein